MKKFRLPFSVYSNSTNENKIQFWTITSSCFVAVFTFFIGIAYQFIVIDEAKEENRRLSHITYVEKVMPLLNASEDFKGFVKGVGNKLQELMSPNTINEKELILECRTMTDSIYSFSKSYLDNINKTKYYFYDKDRQSLSEWCDTLKIGLGAYEQIVFLEKNKNSKDLIEKFIKSFSISEGAKKEAEETIKKFKARDSISYTYCYLEVTKDKLISPLVKINDAIYTEAIILPPFEKLPEDYSTNKLLMWGGFLFVIGIFIWIIILNLVIPSKERNPNLKSITECNRYYDEIQHVIRNYNEDEKIGDEDYVTSIETIYDRLYNQWDDMRKEVNKLNNKLNNNNN